MKSISLFILSFVFSIFSLAGTTNVDLKNLAAGTSEFTRVEFGREIKEGIVLVKQTAFGKPAYTVSYFVGGKPIKTRVLVKSYYQDFLDQANELDPVFKDRRPANLQRCRQSIRRISRDERAKISEKRGCLEHQSRLHSEKFVNWISKMKSFTNGKGI